MTKLTIDDHLISSLVNEDTPLVTSVTGRDLQIPSLRSRVLPKDQGYEEIVLGRIHQLGVSDWEEMMPDLLERMIEYLVEQNTQAAYMPGAGEILSFAKCRWQQPGCIENYPRSQTGPPRPTLLDYKAIR
jgi:hypothetical protein